MKDILKYIVIGVIVAIVGMYVADIAGHLFNGMGGYGFGCIQGICMYLCIVIVTCTGVIVTKISKNTHFDEKSEK